MMIQIYVYDVLCAIYIYSCVWLCLTWLYRCPHGTTLPMNLFDSQSLSTASF